MNFIKDFFVSIFNKMKKKNIDVQPNIKSSDQFTLTASTIEKTVLNSEGNQEENKAYQTVIDIANKLLDKGVKNIALTGPFGSGKSSLLMTLKKDFPQYNYLDISLATLQCNNKGKKEKDESSDLTAMLPEKKVALEPNVYKKEKPSDSQKKSFQDEEDSLNRLIEYSILQQLIYREKATDIPQSRFKRIKHISNHQSFQFSIGITLFVLSCCILFEPKFLYIQTLYDIFTWGKNWKIFWDIISFLYIIWASICLMKKLIITTYNSKINKINFKDGEIDIAENPSIFNKHLDEIIYFFEVTEYDVVIIEDLDRFYTHSIFLKLRELNHLLNNSKAISRMNDRHIVFIYAIRDDIFNDTSRTKFFDYIATVIPVINPSNSCDILLKALKEHGCNEITEETCMELGIFINDMRILKNIVNEFIQYRSKLDTTLDPKKQLGIILYKNYHPDDFALLHDQSGIVFQAIKNKVKYFNSTVQQKDNEIATLKEEQKQILNFYSIQKDNELRTLYVMKCIEKVGAVQNFLDRQNTAYPPNKLTEDKIVFEKLENNELRYHNPSYSNYRELGFTFQDIEKEVDPKYNYQQRLGMTSERVNEIKTEIEKLQQEIIDYKSLPLRNILTKYSAEDFFKDVQEIHLIAFLLKQGYIDENYYDYISYFYPGTMTASDRDFALNVKIGIKKDYSYKIHKPAAVIKQIQDDLFKNGIILNVDLVDFIAVNKELYSKQWTWVINYIKRRKEFSFIEAYYSRAQDQSLFFNEILLLWNEFFIEGVLKKEKHISDLNFEILLRYFPRSKVEQYKKSEFNIYVAERFDFISAKLDIILFDNVKFVTESFEIEYNKLQVEGLVPENLMSFVIEGDFYKLTNETIITVLYFIDQELAEKYKQASYSAILESENESLIDYIKSNINICIGVIFSKDSIQENEDSIIEIAENNDIDDVLKKKYLLHQLHKISDLSIVSQDYWDVVIESDVIKPTWENIEKYISIETNADLSSTIISFISKNSGKLSEQKTIGLNSEPTLSKLFIQLLGSNILPIKSYRNIRKSFYSQFVSVDVSTLEQDRMELLIETNGIQFNDFYYKLIEDHFPSLTSKLLLQNKSKYLSSIALYSLKVNTAIQLLKSDGLTIREKLSIIETIPITTFEDSSILSDLICSILNQAGKLSVDKEYLIAIMNSATVKYQKLCLFIKKCNEPTYDESFVRTGLGLLGGDYAIIALQKGHRRKFSITKENKLLAGYLERNRFISKQFEEKGKIQINAKNIG